MLRTLNLGCGKDVYGTHFVDKYPQRANVLSCDSDLEKIPFPDNYFDVVYTKNLFEHLTNLGFVMQEMYRVLKQGGKLILLTDNANFWGFALGKTHLGKYELSKQSEKVCEDRHYMLFTDWHLWNHARKAGFKDIVVAYTIDNIQAGIRGKTIIVANKIFKHTPLKRMVYNTLRLEAIK